MVRNKLVQICALLLELLSLTALFLPAFDNYGARKSFWNLITEDFSSGAAGGILTNSLYYLPVIISGILLILLESKIRYGFSLLSASAGLTLLLSQYLFPAVEAPYLGESYQVGLYALAAVQCALILLSFFGICLKESSDNRKETPVDFKSNTLELPLEEIDRALLEEEKP